MKSCLAIASLLSLALAQPLGNELSSPKNKLQQRDDDERNDIVDGICKPVTVIFARGTFEPGNVGIFAGPQFFDELADRVGSDNLAVQGVEYDASVEGYFEGGDPDGATKLVEVTNQAASQCPDTKIVLGGYSQGAQVVHLAAPQLSSDLQNRISSVVLFGDPYDGDAIPGVPHAKIDTICFYSDFICDGLPFPGLSHLGYGFTAGQAADFVVGLLGL